jgi:nucleoside transporter
MRITMSNTATSTPMGYEATPQRTASVFSRNSILLAVMMFLQYAVWGLWLLLLPAYLIASPERGGLGFTETQKNLILGLAGALGAVTAPFIGGQLADRYMNAERALGSLLLIGGFVNFGLAYTHSYGPFLLLSLLYSVLYMPTLSLTNSVAFQNLADPAKQFPPIRTFGTIGWAVAAGLFPYLWLNTGNAVVDTGRIADSLRVSGALSLLYALYCFLLLPKTPPKPSAEKLAFKKAFGLFRHRGFLVVSLLALPIAVIHMAFFFKFTPYLTDAVKIPLKWTGLVGSIGQYSEIFFLAILGLLLKRLGFKAVLILGTLAFALRFGIFGLIQPWWLMATAQTLHGMCYAFFYAAAFIYVETVAPADVRHSAQTVFGLIILGVGPVLASIYSSMVPTDYRTFWWLEAGIALAVALALLVLLREDVKPRTEADGDIVPAIESEPLPAVE